MKRIWLVILILFLTGCKSKQRAVSEKTAVETIERTKDTIFKIPSDRSSLTALIECQNMTPVFKVLHSQSGNYLNPPSYELKSYQPSDDLKEDVEEIKASEASQYVLTMDCETRAQELLAQWKETHIREKKEIPVYINELTFWQQVQVYLGRLFLLLLVLLSVLLLLKKRI